MHSQCHPISAQSARIASRELASESATSAENDVLGTAVSIRFSNPEGGKIDQVSSDATITCRLQEGAYRA